MQSTSRRITHCRICGQEMRTPFIVINGLVFCKEHKQQFVGRRRAGVSTEQLSADWGDLLDNWRERPAELDSEIGRRKGATRLSFTQRYQDWLLFGCWYRVKITFKQFLREVVSLLTLGKIKPYKASAILKKGRRSSRRRRLSRMGDFLAINTQTGECRRFVDMDEGEVLDDLQGVRPASGQEEIASFWRNSAPTGRRERLQELLFQRVSGPDHRLLIRELVRLIPFSLYGPIDNPCGLDLKSTGWSGRVTDDITSVNLSFKSTDPENSFDLINSRANQRSVYQPSENDEQYILDLDEHLFQSHHLSDIQREQVGPPTVWRGELHIAEEVFSGEIRSWSHPYQLARFTCKNERIILSGLTSGLTQDQLIQVLKDLKIINQREDTLAHYQREIDEEQARLISAYRK